METYLSMIRSREYAEREGLLPLHIWEEIKAPSPEQAAMMTKGLPNIGNVTVWVARKSDLKLWTVDLSIRQKG